MLRGISFAGPLRLATLGTSPRRGEDSRDHRARFIFLSPSGRGGAARSRRRRLRRRAEPERAGGSGASKGRTILRIVLFHESRAALERGYAPRHLVRRPAPPRYARHLSPK